MKLSPEIAAKLKKTDNLSVTVRIVPFNSAPPQAVAIYKDWYSELAAPSPFLCPSVIHGLSQYKQADLLIVADSSTEEILWAQPCKIDRNKNSFTFFGEEGADSISFLTSPHLAKNQKKNIFLQVISTINPNSFLFRKFNIKDANVRLFKEALSDLKYYHYSVPYISCPIATYDREDSRSFKKIFSKSTVRNLSNRLNKQAAVTYEIIGDLADKELNNWLSDFVLLHELRWAFTDTPSIFIDKTEREKFFKKVKGGLRDKKMVLFSIKINGERYGLVLAAVCGQKLFYHMIANRLSKTYRKFSVFKILIKYIGEWMHENGFDTIDFGLGEEKYKLEFANGEEKIIELYAGKSRLKTNLRAFIKNKYYHSPIQKAYLASRNKFSRYRKMFSETRQRITLLFNDTINHPKKAMRKFWSFLMGEKTYFYYLKSSDAKNEDKIEGMQLSTSSGVHEILEFYEHEAWLTPQKRGKYISNFIQKKNIPVTITKNGVIKAIAWVAPAWTDQSIPEEDTFENILVITDCLTAKNSRGKGLYPFLLRGISSSNPGKTTIIYTNDWNKSSIRGIQKAGFTFYAEKKK